MSNIRVQASFVGTSAQFTTANKTLLAGEFAYETDSGLIKVGDGVTAWNSLPYFTGGVAIVQSVAGKTGVVILVKADVGLGNVDNTSDLNKPVSTAQAAADAAVAAFSVQRGNHTGTQVASTISDFTTEVDARITAQKGNANGLAELDGTGKLKSSQIPPSLIGSVVYQSTWDASSNSPSLTSSVGTKGFYYKVNVAGSTNLDGINDWKIGDWAIFNGLVWEKIDNTDQVVSVNGQQGAVVLNTDNISEGTTNKYFTDGRAQTAAVQNSLTPASSIKAPSVDSVTTALAGKLTDVLTTIGDIFYRNLSNITDRLPIGSEDFILRAVGGVPTWVEENLSQDFGGGSDGNSVLSGLLPLSQATYFNNLTLVAGGQIITNGYPLYCKKLDLTNADPGAIRYNGNNGNNSTTQTGVAGGGSLGANILGVSGAGGTGATSVINTAGAQAAAPTGISPANGGNGGAGGAGGAGTAGAGGASRAGATTGNTVIFDVIWPVCYANT